MDAPFAKGHGALITRMESSAFSQSARARAVARADAPSIPWHLGAVVFAATSVIVGLIWDISWHMTIGRDSFWTPAHLAIYTGGIVAGLASGAEVLRRTFAAREASKDSSVTVWRMFLGPLGGWLCIWGAVAMLTSAPFDDWWHNAYGLDVQILSPPHSVLAVGFLAILIGAMLLAAAHQGRAHSASSPWIVAYTSGLVLTIASIMFYEYQDRVLMHAGIFYIVAAAVYPLYLVSAGVAVKLRWPTTAAAGVYTAIMLAQLWILPLFAATPLLGPIRQPVTHMVPLNFPVLVLLPAVVLDVVLHQTESRGAWFRAMLLGIAFVLVLFVVQWPFADFLVSPQSRNWFFYSNNLPYMMPTDSLEGRGEFLRERPLQIFGALALAMGLAVLSSRAGIGWGRWLRSVQR